MTNFADNQNDIKNSGEQYLDKAAKYVKNSAQTAKDKAVEWKEKAAHYTAENPWKCVVGATTAVVAISWLIKHCVSNKKSC